ncbi:MAG: TetR/AcrR family transcriptional regulator [bacterium]
MKEKVRREIREVITRAEPHKDVFILRPLKQILKKELSLGEDPEDAEEIIKDFLEEVTDAYEASKLRSKSLLRELFMESIELGKKMGVESGELARELLYFSLRDSEADRGKRARKTQDKRERILQAALKVISENGYQTATMEMIAEGAGVSKGLVYRYYESKEALVQELVDSMFDRLAQQVNDSVHQDLDALDLIQLHVRNYLEFIERNKEFYTMMLNARNIMGPADRAHYYTRVLEHAPGMKHKIVEAAQQGKIKFTSFFTVYYGVMGFLDGVIHKWLRSNCSYSLVNEIPVILETLFYGMVTDEYASKHRVPYMEWAKAALPPAAEKLEPEGASDAVAAVAPSAAEEAQVISEHPENPNPSPLRR